jgi:hypothetical protein
MDRRKSKITIQIQNIEHLCREIAMSGKGNGQKEWPDLLSEGPRRQWRAKAKRDSCEQKFRLVKLKYHSQQEPPPPHLIPENASQTKHAYIEAQAEQANEHDEK